MKKILSALTIGLGLLAGAAEKNPVFSDSFDSEANWYKNPACKSPQFGGGGSHKIVPNGGSGKCLFVETNAKQTFMFNMRRSVPVVNGSRLRIVFLAKGKGKISINTMGSNGKQTKYLQNFYEIVNTETWEEIPFIIDFKDPKGSELKAFTMRINITPNSKLWIDSCVIREMK